MQNQVVAVALSGGVDSLVTGYLLKQQYKDVFGIHFTTGYEIHQIDTQELENQLGFPVYKIDLSREFEKRVIDYFIGTYLKGRTPNPCLICNQTIKFGALFNSARDLGANKIATGHYASIALADDLSRQQKKRYVLEKGTDLFKDQSYFLSLLCENQLKNIVFPLAGLTKQSVKKIAVDNNLNPLFPSESQDICFIHDNSFSNFIIKKLGFSPQPGLIVNIQGKVVGQHKGLHQYTIGQRRGLNCPASEPYYVSQIDIEKNQLIVCFKKDLIQKQFTVKNINWNYSAAEYIEGVLTKIRYSHKGEESSLKIYHDKIDVTFNTPQNAVTPGQGAVFYKEGRVLGAGIIQ